MNNEVDKGIKQYSLFIDEPNVGKTVFGFEQYINTVCGFVNGTDPKFTIGVFGKWGVGKTTLLRNTEVKLTNSGFNCLFFNAWRYEQEPAHISIPLILEILMKLYEKNKDQIDRSLTDRRQSFKERLNQDIHV